jgi:tetratricopeptide (TPR) repeat protein
MLKGEPIDHLSDHLSDHPSAETILSVAEWAGFEKTAEWHRRLAMCLGDFMRFEEAKHHFQIALDLDDQLLKARAGLANIYSMEKEYEKSLELYKGNLRIMESLLQNGGNGDHEDQRTVELADVVECYNCIAENSRLMDDQGTALIHFRKAFEMSIGEYTSLFSYLKIVAGDKNRNNREIINLLKSMEINVDGHDHTHLTQCLLEKVGESWLHSFYNTIASAAQSIGELEWLENAYRTAIVVARRQQKSTVAFALTATLADLYLAYHNKETSGLQIWKAIVYFPVTFMQGNLQLKLFQTFAGKIYGIYLLTAALQGWYWYRRGHSVYKYAGRYLQV